MENENNILKTPLNKEQIIGIKRMVEKGESQLEKVVVLEAGGNEQVNRRVYLSLKEIIDKSRIIKIGTSETARTCTPIKAYDYLDGSNGVPFYGEGEIINHFSRYKSG